MWAWSWEARSTEQQRADGWAGVLTAPRRVQVVDGHLQVAPLPELRGLRARELPVMPVPTPEGWLASGVVGDALDLEVDLGPAADRVELRLRRSPGQEEVTVITFDRNTAELWLDRERASLDTSARGGRHGGAAGRPGQPRRLRVLVDRSIVEVFVDDRVALTARIYPTRPDSTGVEVVGAADALADVRLRAWTLGSIWVEPAVDEREPAADGGSAP